VTYREELRKRRGKEKNLLGEQTIKDHFFNGACLFCVNLAQIHLPLCFTNISKVSEVCRVANKSGLQMPREKLVGGKLLLEKNLYLERLAQVLCLTQKMGHLFFREAL